MVLISRSQLQQFITGIALIILFISIVASPFNGTLMSLWLVFAVVGIAMFFYSSKLKVFPPSFWRGLAMIIIFISIKASPLTQQINGSYLYFMIGSIIVFIYAPSISKRFATD